MTHKPVIAFILPDLSAGGAEMVLIRLMNALPREKYDPVLVTVRSDGVLKDFIGPGIPFHPLHASHVTMALPKLYKKLREINPAVVVSTMAHMNFATLTLRPFFKNTKFIVRESTVPDCTLEERGALGPVIRMLYPMLYRLADKIIAPAQIILEKMNSQLKIPSKTMGILPNPVDISTINISTPPAANNGTIRFIAAGRLHPEKGFDRLIKALKDYHGTAWHLTLLGEGEQREQLEYMIKALKFEDKVSLPGFRREPWQEFSAADCFLLPSRWEGLPNAALEALACGTPVIAMRDAGGIVEIAAEAPQGAVTLAHTMQDFLKAMEKVAPAQQKKSLMPERYEKNRVNADFEKLLQEMLA
ncbi:MAG: glycosyltransferase [Alphaproteobacteria bacterium PRO2]|nr:glycosyltransferase [Alphaproteobacteria bacterium PRO2]